MSIVDQVQNKSNRWLSQFVRYGISGIIAFVVDFCLLRVLTSHFGLYYQIGVGCGYIAGLLITYTLSIFWVFDARRLSNKYLEFLLFIIIGIIGLILTHLCMYFLTELIWNINYQVSKIVTTSIITFFNFFAKKMMLFKK